MSLTHAQSCGSGWFTSGKPYYARTNGCNRVSSKCVCVCVCVCEWSSLNHCLSRGQLHRRRLVLNYRDSSGDLVEMTEQMDIELMKSEGIPPRRQSDSNHAPWAVYVTEVGDYKVYSTDPHKR